MGLGLEQSEGTDSPKAMDVHMLLPIRCITVTAFSARPTDLELQL